MGAQLTHEDFQPHLNREFRFAGQPQVLRLTKIEVSDRPPIPGLDYNAFLLLFAGPRGNVLPEGFYAAETEGGVRFDFYIQPIHTAAQDRQEYQVLFN